MADVIEIARLGLTDQVAQRLRNLLIEGRIAPGARADLVLFSDALNVRNVWIAGAEVRPLGP
jgi:N-acetylglucosamine-6-phosphate deacetylase